jgi:hypothetical protein
MFRKLLSLLTAPSKKQTTSEKAHSKKDFQKPRTRKISPGYRMILAGILILTIPLVFFGKFFAIVSLHGIAAVSRMYYRWFKFSIGIELGIFAITLTALAHGPMAGIIVGILHFLISWTVTKEPANIVPICLLGYGAVGFFAGILPLTNIVFFGMLMTFIYDLITTPLFVGVLHYNLPRELFFISTHLLFNYWVFSTFGEWGLKLVGVA